jgi:hypothetical protein
MKVLKVNWTEMQFQFHKVSSDSLKKLLEKFLDVFSPQNGLIRNFKARVVLKDDAVPRFLKSSPVPFA